MKIPINPMKSSHEPENENILFYEIGVGWWMEVSKGPECQMEDGTVDGSTAENKQHFFGNISRILPFISNTHILC